MAEIRLANPPGMGTPFAPYSQVARVKASELLFVAGQVATGPNAETVGRHDFNAQATQTFANIELALKANGVGWANVVLFTSYLVDSQDIPKYHAWRVLEFPKMFPSGVYPTNTLLIISRLVKEEFLLEVQAIAAV
jgi:enamine deaminase RidA (YjgF/YER057c/UK114 family)